MVGSNCMDFLGWQALNWQHTYTEQENGRAMQTHVYACGWCASYGDDDEDEDEGDDNGDDDDGDDDDDDDDDDVDHEDDDDGNDDYDELWVMDECNTL